MGYIDKSTLLAEIERIENELNYEIFTDEILGKRWFCKHIKSFLDTIEVKDPYEQCVQYDSIKAGIQAHAKTYAFNTESLLFNQLTKEQQELWRKEIQQACISGGEAGVELARDIRYKENVEGKDIKDAESLVEEVDLEKKINKWIEDNTCRGYCSANIRETAEHFFELGMAASNKIQKGE